MSHRQFVRYVQLHMEHLESRPVHATSSKAKAKSSPEMAIRARRAQGGEMVMESYNPENEELNPWDLIFPPEGTSTQETQDLISGLHEANSQQNQRIAHMENGLSHIAAHLQRLSTLLPEAVVNQAEDVNQF